MTLTIAPAIAVAPDLTPGIAATITSPATTTSPATITSPTAITSPTVTTAVTTATATSSVTATAITTATSSAAVALHRALRLERSGELDAALDHLALAWRRAADLHDVDALALLAGDTARLAALRGKRRLLDRVLAAMAGVDHHSDHDVAWQRVLGWRTNDPWRIADAAARLRAAGRDLDAAAALLDAARCAELCGNARAGGAWRRRSSELYAQLGARDDADRALELPVTRR